MKHHLAAVGDRIFSSISHIADWRWYNDPLGAAPRASAEEYTRLFQAARKAEYSQIDALESEIGFSIDREWMDSLALHTQITVKKSDLAYPHGRILYSLLRKYIAEHPGEYITIIETGTARGFSILCMAKALMDGGAQGRLITLDVLPHHQKMYWNCIDDSQGRKTRAELLSPWSDLLKYVVFVQGDSLLQLPKVGVDRVNFAFIDAQHTKKNVLLEYQAVSKLQEKGDVIVFDDVTPGTFDGVVEAVKDIDTGGRYTMRYLTASKQRAYAWGTKT
ncbi:O-methyltransferase [Aquabacter cavernae]|uniref:O-methyltransferase n=1 Tax=Aquabacter cavernae TaxID=2496029 RepID=UPI0013E09BE9|nr:class I SAM-dependent methyltransferase [Aquabacter cavernae]